MWGLRRNYDFFFKVNPDMLDRRAELIKKFEKEILVVLPYKGEGSQGNEIRLALNISRPIIYQWLDILMIH